MRRSEARSSLGARGDDKMTWEGGGFSSQRAQRPW